MNKIMLITLPLLFAFTAHAKGGFGLGLVIGDPTGISAKYNLDYDRALDFALAFESGDNSSVLFQSTYLVNKEDAIRADRIDLNVHYGIGFRFKQINRDNPGNNEDEDETQLGIRAPIGLNYMLREIPLELFGEASLTLNVVEDTDVDIGLGIGLRYFF